MTTTADGVNLQILETVRDFVTAPRGAFIGGNSRAPQGDLIDTLDPSTGQVITQVSESGQEDVDAAVAAAGNAFRGEWGHMTAGRREVALHRFADLIERTPPSLPPTTPSRAASRSRMSKRSTCRSRWSSSGTTPDGRPSSPET